MCEKCEELQAFNERLRAALQEGLDLVASHGLLVRQIPGDPPGRASRWVSTAQAALDPDAAR
jgi:hypothetical protein